MGNSTGEPAARTWRYAIIGGVVSIPLTLFVYWQSGMGNDMSLSMVFFGGLLAGYLAAKETDGGRGVGFRAGLIGGLPVFRIGIDIVQGAVAAGGPLWFQGLAMLLSVGLIATLLVLAGIVGYIGAKVGRWLAAKTGRRPATPSTS